MDLTEQTYLKLEASEAAVTAAASRVFAAYVASYDLQDVDEDQLIENAVRIAMKIAAKADDMIASDDELDSKGKLPGLSGSTQAPQILPRRR